MAQPDLIVITGGPGGGKTSLIHELERQGYACAQEVAREIIREQLAGNGTALPWADKESFAELMLERSQRQWRDLQERSSIVFVDRGLPDTLCYARLAGLSDSLQRRALERCREFRYYGTAFIAPAWEEIYITDAERRQSFDEAVVTVQMMACAYRDCGYDLVELPKVSIKERAAFVLATLAAR